MRTRFAGFLALLTTVFVGSSAHAQYLAPYITPAPVVSTGYAAPEMLSAPATTFVPVQVSESYVTAPVHMPATQAAYVAQPGQVVTASAVMAQPTAVMAHQPATVMPATTVAPVAAPKVLTAAMIEQPPQIPAGYGASASCGCGSASCTGSCGGNCGSCGCGDCRTYKYAFFGEYLYGRFRDNEVAYAVEANSVVAPAVQRGPIGVLDQEYQSGFKLGFGFNIDGCNSLFASYSMLDSRTTDFTTSDPARVVHSMVVHPATVAAATDTLRADAEYEINMRLVDVGLESKLFDTGSFRLSYDVGFRWAQLEQYLQVTHSVLGTYRNRTDIDFSGAGVRFGLNGEKCMGMFLAYTKAHASYLGGVYNAQYQQTIVNGNALDVNTTWEAGRLTHIYDFEMGIGWQSMCGTWRATAGYTFGAWVNVVKTDEWIDSVRRNNFVGLGDTMTIDGFVARIEGRF